MLVNIVNDLAELFFFLLSSIDLAAVHHQISAVVSLSLRVNCFCNPTHVCFFVSVGVSLTMAGGLEVVKVFVDRRGRSSKIYFWNVLHKIHCTIN